MFYRSFMEKYRPLYAPDEPAAAASGEAAAAAAADGQAAAVAPAAPSAEPAAAAPGAAGEAAASAQEGNAAPAASGEPPKAEPSLLEAAEIKKAEPAKAEGENKEQPAPAEAAKPEGDKKPEGDVKETAVDDKSKPQGDKKAADADPAKKDATAEEPPAPIKYDAFKVPDGIKLDDQRISAFTEIAGKAQVSQEVAQGLLDLHVSEMQRFATEVTKQAEQHQRDVWNKLNDTWKTEARNDPQIGGNRFETSLSRAKAVLEEYGGTPEQVRELLAHTSHNGMGNFPGFLRFLDNIAEALNVFEDSAVAANPTGAKPQRGPGNRGWYPSMNGEGPKT